MLAEGYKDTLVTFADDHGKQTQRRVRLAFPNRQHKLEASSGAFYDTFWTRMQRETGIAKPRKYHSIGTHLRRGRWSQARNRSG